MCRCVCVCVCACMRWWKTRPTATSQRCNWVRWLKEVYDSFLVENQRSSFSFAESKEKMEKKTHRENYKCVKLWKRSAIPHPLSFSSYHVFEALCRHSSPVSYLFGKRKRNAVHSRDKIKNELMGNVWRAPQEKGATLKKKKSTGLFFSLLNRRVERCQFALSSFLYVCSVFCSAEPPVVTCVCVYVNARAVELRSVNNQPLRAHCFFEPPPKKKSRKETREADKKKKKET